METKNIADLITSAEAHLLKERKLLETATGSEKTVIETAIRGGELRLKELKAQQAAQNAK